jgi:hypothetical protein
MFDFHFLDISFLYHRVENLDANGSDGSISGKVDPFNIFQEKNEINTSN